MRYADIPNKLLNQENFAMPSGSISAKKKITCYSVLSYDTEIFKVDFKSGVIMYNDTRYSNTTARIQSIIKEFISKNNMYVKLVTGKQFGFRF